MDVPDKILRGLTRQEVTARVESGDTNDTHEQTSRSISSIVKANVLTRLNAIVVVMTAAVLSVGSWIDASFGYVAVLNSIIGIFQEMRAKLTLDRLAILHAPSAVVVRDGQEQTISSKEIVRDEVIRLRTGDQILADGVITAADGLEVNESLLTGEADPVAKATQETVMAGSFIVAGEAYMQATKVGVNTYSHGIVKHAKKFAVTRSELVEGTNKLLKYISWVIVATAPLIIGGQILLSDVHWREALIRSIAAIDGMIPQGLVLLTSLAFMLATLALARRKVLIQQLPAVEGLARVDTICLDKTGTLTEGVIVFDELVLFDKALKTEAQAMVGAFARDPSSPTLHALHQAFPAANNDASYVVRFSSARKWSAMAANNGYWIIGAPEMVYPDDQAAPRKQASAIAAQGKRVLLITRTSTKPSADKPLANLHPVGLVVLREKIRDDAQQTLQYFAEQHVALKIISGDSPQTVQAIAQQVGVAGTAIDARSLPKDKDELAAIMEQESIFGRVTPDQKQAMVQALQSKGHIVAMTGDGVNDVLALKDADIGIAMGNGAQATKAIAELVLLDNKFSRMPRVLAEGRRVIANIERVASLFIVKNVYSLVLVLSLTALAFSYPFLPRHLTILSALTIGIPAFFLSLAPNTRRYVPGFLSRVLRFAVPAGAIIAAALFVNYIVISAKDGAIEIISTTSSIIVMAIASWIILCLSRPLRAWKIGLLLALCASFAVLLATPFARELAGFEVVDTFIIWTLGCSLAGIIGVEVLWRHTSLRLAARPAVEN